MTIEHLTIIGLFLFLMVREVMHFIHLNRLEDKALAGSYESYKAAKRPEVENEITQVSEDPNEIPIDGLNPIPLPKEFNVHVEGEDKPRNVKLYGGT